jgi:hypothetical protein
VGGVHDHADQRGETSVDEGGVEYIQQHLHTLAEWFAK